MAPLSLTANGQLICLLSISPAALAEMVQCHMPHSRPFMSAAHRDAVASILAGILGSSVAVLLSGPAGAGKTAVLEVVAAKLATRSQRVVKVAAAPGQPFGMRELAAQIARMRGTDGLADDHVGQAFEALTTAGPDCRRIVLIVDGAEALLPETLRFIQLACEMQFRLQVLFAARPEFEGCLDDQEFAFLRGRLAPTLVLAGLSEDEAAAFVLHRLRAAGLAGKAPVAHDTLKMLVSHGMGNPGRIGAVLDQALAVQRCQTPNLISVMQHGQRARTEAGALRAGSTHVVRRSRPDEPAASLGSTSPGQRRPHRRAWALAMLGLTGAVGLIIAIAASGARVQRDQTTTVSAGSVTASSAGGPADVAQAPPAAPSPADPIGPEAAGPVSTTPPDDPAVLTRPEARATVVVTGPARTGLPADTTAVDGASYPGGTGPVTPSSNPASGVGARLAGISRPGGDAVPRALDPAKSGRLTTTLTTARDDRRCRDVLFKMQLGEEPTDADRNLLRSGCRLGR